MSTKTSFFDIDYIEFKHMHCKEAQHKKKLNNEEIRTDYFIFCRLKTKTRSY